MIQQLDTAHYQEHLYKILEEGWQVALAYDPTSECCTATATKLGHESICRGKHIDAYGRSKEAATQRAISHLDLHILENDMAIGLRNLLEAKYAGQPDPALKIALFESLGILPSPVLTAPI